MQICCQYIEIQYSSKATPWSPASFPEFNCGIIWNFINGNFTAEVGLRRKNLDILKLNEQQWTTLNFTYFQAKLKQQKFNPW